GIDAVGQNDGGHVAEIGDELLEPALEVEAVPQDEVGAVGAHDVLRRRLVAMDLRTRLGDGDDVCGVAGNIRRHVGDHGEGGDDLEAVAGRLRLKTGGGERQHGKEGHGDETDRRHAAGS